MPNYEDFGGEFYYRKFHEKVEMDINIHLSVHTRLCVVFLGTVFGPKTSFSKYPCSGFRPTKKKTRENSAARVQK